MVRELWRLLWTLIHKPRKPATPAQKKARQAAAKKAAKTRAAHKKQHKPGAKSPAPRSGAVHHPKKAAHPRPATHAA